MKQEEHASSVLRTELDSAYCRLWMCAQLNIMLTRFAVVNRHNTAMVHMFLSETTVMQQK
jgi:hypothetical protein